MKSRHILLNVERQPALTRVLANREAYLVGVRAIGSRRDLHTGIVTLTEQRSKCGIWRHDQISL